MENKVFLFTAFLLLLAASLVQEAKRFGPLPPGKRRREPHRQVCIRGYKKTLDQLFVQNFSLTIDCFLDYYFEW